MGSVFQSLLVALLISIGSLPLYFLSAAILPYYLATKLVIVASFIAYQCYLIAVVRARPGGKVVFGATGILATCFLLVLPVTIKGTVILAAGLLWVTRLAANKRRLSIIVLDLILSAASVIAWYWGVSTAGSLALGMWCLLLVQSLIVFISNNNVIESNTNSGATKLSNFESAYQRAYDVLGRVG